MVSEGASLETQLFNWKDSDWWHFQIVVNKYKLWLSLANAVWHELKVLCVQRVGDRLKVMVVWKRWVADCCGPDWKAQCAVPQLRDSSEGGSLSRTRQSCWPWLSPKTPSLLLLLLQSRDDNHLFSQSSVPRFKSGKYFGILRGWSGNEEEGVLRNNKKLMQNDSLNASLILCVHASCICLALNVLYWFPL